MKKILFGFMLLGGFFFLESTSVFASEEISYDLENHDSIETFELEEGDEPIDVTIVENPSMLRMADKSYTISKNKNKVWSISYTVSVKNNKIVSAYGGQFKASQGKFSNTSVKRSSDSFAFAKGVWTNRAYSTTLQVKATVKNKNLVVE